MRKFILRAGDGSTFPLYGQEFVYQPKGLGYNWTARYAHTINGAYIETDKKLSQNAVAGEIVFTVNPYQRYKELLRFCAVTDTLYLGYQPTDGGDWYYLRGLLATVNKTELTAAGLLRVPFTFRATSVWRRENPITVNITNSSQQLRYNQQYDYTYGDENAAGSYSFTADGHFPAAVVIEAPGEMSNPVVTLKYSDTGKTIGRCAVAATIPSGNKLKLSTVPNEAGVWSVTAAGVETSLLNSIDLTNNNFFRLPVGRNVTITITAGSAATVAADMEIIEYFGSV